MSEKCQELHREIIEYLVEKSLEKMAKILRECWKMFKYRLLVYNFIRFCHRPIKLWNSRQTVVVSASFKQRAAISQKLSIRGQCFKRDEQMFERFTEREQRMRHQFPRLVRVHFVRFVQRDSMIRTLIREPDDGEKHCGLGVGVRFIIARRQTGGAPMF